MCSIDLIERTTEAQPARALEDLEREICTLAAEVAAATCRWLVLLAEFDERRGWAEWGVRSCAHWLSWRCSIGLVTGREHVRVARRLSELPLMRQAFSAGELSYCKVRALTRVASAETEEYLVHIARHATGAQLDKLVRGYRGALSATLEAARDSHERRHLTCSWEEDGSLRLQGRLPADDGALLIAALAGAEEPEWSTTASERRADALVAVARTALDAGEATAGGDPCEVVVHVDADMLAFDAVRERSEIADGPSIAPETARRLGCDAALTRIIERDGHPLSVGRRTRTIPPSLRRALRGRDGGCRFPGCTHRRFLHAHHIRHWAHGGATKLENLVQLCSHHHRLVHEGGFSVECSGRATICFRRPDGTAIPAVGRGRATRAGGFGVKVDADTCRPLSAGDHLDYGIAVEVLLGSETRGARAR